MIIKTLIPLQIFKTFMTKFDQSEFKSFLRAYGNPVSFYISICDIINRMETAAAVPLAVVSVSTRSS